MDSTRVLCIPFSRKSKGYYRFSSLVPTFTVQEVNPDTRSVDWFWQLLESGRNEYKADDIRMHERLT
jgi:hypothetical protein